MPLGSSFREFFLCHLLCPWYTRLHPGAHGPCPTEERALERLFANPAPAYPVLVDVGCGGGRVLAWWLRQGLGEKTLVGLEIQQSLAAWSRWRFRHHPTVRILTGDAVHMVDQLPLQPTLFYLFNPFDASTLRFFLHALRRRYAPGSVEVLYYNSEHADVFSHEPCWTVAPLPLPEPCWPALRARLESGVKKPPVRSPGDRKETCAPARG